ncbi:molybdopterin biosynthesis protein MoeB [Rhodanobacter sp. FW510-R12]|uniref:molybdopterin-synthase adenylyltransferase MoeB n=1 Tax=unclassified Rhodanobacter TaxID=2621553 RepID=UPI0007A9CCBB|nr:MULTISPECIES: molybdopterin-synthase adenylyltransferase MoeB [unclassified Rhodanobacter]KZC15721.1 molybdopterin biosynthesis protein MoeB [Rhodanobacter sp. FW104-R8]KZC28987.1 molybdopterin biosynthesis protein MoeB [Rhodanobacter sp. FW510-T8]KZC29283.1 molybdopterin biosynthesis protein MoeB [Rhodanobacter sp. FW510-R10]
MSESLNRETWLGALRGRIAEIAPAQALARQAQGGLLIDVREDAERAAGMPADALGLSRGFLELRIEQVEASRDRPLLLLCGSGQRSLLAAEALQRLGYRDVSSVAGGFERWKAEGLPVSAGTLDADAAERYARQLRLPQVGEAGQARLAAAKVVLLGAGGLGAPAALYLAAAGVGQLTLIDDDRVERSNLHRQVIHADARVGMAKTESARIALQALNPRIRVEVRNERLQADNVERLLAGHDLLIDGADNFPARYLLAAASQRLKLPMVYGAVERFSGQLSVFDPRRADSPCYRCLFPEPPAAADAPNCSEAGVLGVLPGIVGLLQATEALKLILGLGEPLVGRLLGFDALGMHFRETRLPRDPDCPGCGAGAVFGGYAEVARLCSVAG